MVQDPETLTLALAALALESASENRVSLELDIWAEDRVATTQRFYNIAAQKGWFPHSLEKNTIDIILPAEDLETLTQSKEDLYGWLEQHRSDTAPPAPPALGDNPAYVHVWTSTTVGTRRLLALIGAISASVFACAAIVYVMVGLYSKALRDSL